MTKLLNKPTSTVDELAKKYKVSTVEVKKQLMRGIKVEKEHTNNPKVAREIALDHLGEKLDYYKKLAKIEEESTTGAVRDLGYVTGDTTKIKTLTNFINEGISAGPEREVPVVGDPTGASRKMSNVEEDKDPCWKGYEMVGMKKKAGRKVSNCVPKEQVEPSASRYTERPTYEESKYPDTTERGIYQQEGYASIGHPFDRFGDVNRRAKFYGGKPKPTTTKSDEKDDTYKDSKQGGKVKFAKAVKAKIDEVAMSMPPNVEMPVPGIRRQAGASQQRLQGNTYRAGQSFASQGTTVKSSGARMGSSYGTMKPTTTDVKRNISNRFNPSFGQQGSNLGKPSSVRTSLSFSQGGGQVAQKMSTASPSQVIAKMSDAGRQAAAAVSKAAPTAAKVAGTVARVAAGPAATAAAAVMSPTPAGEKKSEFQRQADVAKGVSYKSQGRSISDYEKQALTPKSYEAPKSPENPKVNAPTPPERPQYFSRGQAFQSARGEAGGGEGKFSYDNKSYQTNVSGEKYKPASQLKQTSVQEDWQKVNRQDKTDGLSQKAVNAYRRENPGSKLKTAVTEKNPTGERASRRKSFCSRMGGMKKRLTSAKTARDPDSRINKALRRWNCEESVISELKAETLGAYIKKASAARKEALNKEGGAKADVKTWGKRQKGITTAIKKLTNEETKMDNKDLINEAIESILDNDLNTMKENLMVSLQEKAIEKLEERKKEIAANYFAE